MENENLLNLERIITTNLSKSNLSQNEFVKNPFSREFISPKYSRVKIYNTLNLLDDFKFIKGIENIKKVLEENRIKYFISRDDLFENFVVKTGKFYYETNIKTINNLPCNATFFKACNNDSVVIDSYKNSLMFKRIIVQPDGFYEIFEYNAVKFKDKIKNCLIKHTIFDGNLKHVNFYNPEKTVDSINIPEKKEIEIIFSKNGIKYITRKFILNKTFSEQNKIFFADLGSNYKYICLVEKNNNELFRIDKEQSSKFVEIPSINNEYKSILKNIEFANIIINENI